MSEKHGVCAGYLMPHPPIIIPQVGGGREKQAAKTIAACNRVAEDILKLRPDTILVISPHAPMFSDYVFIYDAPVLKGSFSAFGAPQVKLSFNQDNELRGEIKRLMSRDGLRGGALSASEMRRFNIEDSLDHGVLVPLYYIASKYSSFQLVAMSCSGLDIQSLYRLGSLLREAAESKKRSVCVIASGDMSHKVNAESPYGACKEGAQFDRLVCDYISYSNIPALLSIKPDMREKAAECGYRSLVMLCGVFDKEKLKTNLYCYEAPFGIGYCVASFAATGIKDNSAFEAAYPKISRQNENAYVAAARAALEHHVKNHKTPTLSDLTGLENEPALLQTRAAVFVSLKKFGELRGCIGTTEPTRDCIAEEIIHNAVCAGTQDPRFEPVKEDELNFIEYSVDVLSEPVPAKKEELDPKMYGVIVRSGWRSGLLLPDLEGVDTVEQQLDIACRKAGISPDESYKIEKFTVTRYSGHTKKGE